MSVTVENGTTQLGVNLKPGKSPGTINRYNVHFNNGSNEPLIDCLDCGKVLDMLFPKKIAEIDKHIDAILNREGYFTKW